MVVASKIKEVSSVREVFSAREETASSNSNSLEGSLVKDRKPSTAGDSSRCNFSQRTLISITMARQRRML